MRLIEPNIEAFNKIPRSGKTCIHCNRPMLDSSVGCHSCDNINCKHFNSITILHLYSNQLLEEIDKNFPEATQEEKDFLFWSYSFD